LLLIFIFCCHGHIAATAAPTEIATTVPVAQIPIHLSGLRYQRSAIPAQALEINIAFCFVSRLFHTSLMNPPIFSSDVSIALLNIVPMIFLTSGGIVNFAHSSKNAFISG
jgi:hypothetical protein